ncbi:DUF4349 domain-containing protein [Fusibacter paucivorans]|uniref:Anti-sigma-W factor RsiW n=1 Tax=Fusibacter paucivorans TaxID=76009 RepID=A0ABS5PQJ1_9FIRM|nr:DUF4349 domain-containing protein [Fusibacter paucivorans]MBS7527321.1 DUF4349 domain-containing protein [Fusibacter paucivorans]
MCDQYKTLMNAYIDGDITEAQIKELEQHVAHCESCMIEFEELKYVKTLLDEEVLMPLPNDFDERLHQRLLEAAATVERKEENETIGASVMGKIKKLGWKSRALGGVAAVLIIGVVVVKTALPYGIYMGGSSDTAAAANYITAEESTEMAPQSFGISYDNDTAADVAESKAVTAATEARGADGGYESPEMTSNDSSQNSQYRNGRIILKTANLSIDVESYDETVAAIKAILEGTEGYIESEQTSYKTRYTDRDNLRYGSFVLRVPADLFDQMLDSIKANGFVNYDNVNSEDVTKYYRDTASQVENLKITENRLREILEKATDVSDILEIENELTRTRREIDALTNQLKNWEDLADLSYVYVEIDEVESLNPTIEPIDDSVLSKAKEGFIDTINAIVKTTMEIFIWLVAKSPVLLILAILAGVGSKIWRKKRHKKI